MGRVRIVEIQRRNMAKPKYKRKKAKWRVVETKEQDGAAVQVSELPLRIPRYSFRVGSSNFEDGALRIGNHLTSFNAESGALLLAELGEKYRLKREAKKKEVEDAKQAWIDNNNADSSDSDDPSDSED